MLRTAVCLCSLLLLTSVACADVKVPALFTDHMVLQQGQKNRVWGWADPGESVTVTIANKPYTATPADGGRWEVVLEPLSVGGPYTLSIQGKNTITISDVLIGEVWICSGQSNMQWSVNQSTDADLDKLSARFPNIRFISVPQVGTQEPQNDFKGSWSVCTPETIGECSGVGFYFGRQLHLTLGVPVGLIDDAWGGSACEAWIRRDILAADEKYAPLMERWAGMEKDLASPEAAAKFQAQLEAWEKAVKEARAAGKQLPQRPRNPADVLTGNARPGNIYNGVLKPTIGYGIKGAIWYQGESNASRAYQYRDLFPLMIQSWRDEWGQGDFPFYWVQLADFKAEQPEPVESDWAELREAQTLTQTKLKNVGQAVIIDIGEGKDIHPKNKVDVGKRLARWALAKDYGINVAYRSPEYASMEKVDGKVILKFDHVGSGLRTFDVAEARGFAVAGEDKKWVWANATVTGKDTIAVSSDVVPHPVAVRYAWSDNPVVNVYSGEGLPLTPFRTDDWPGVTINAR